MQPISDSLIAELEPEAKTTRTVLNRVPDNKLTWKPHHKSMSLGQLAHHIATTPAGVAQAGTKPTVAYETFPPPPQPESAAAIVATFDEGVARARTILRSMNDADLMTSWTLTKGGQPVMTVPRIELYRSIMLNHLYHHRGQLSVYLRLLDIPAPSIYGPSADENPFG